MIFNLFSHINIRSLELNSFPWSFPSFLVFSRSLCLNATKFILNAFGTCHLNGLASISIQDFSPKFTGFILPILSVSASLLNLLIIITFFLPRKVIFKLNLVPELWRVCTNFYAIILTNNDPVLKELLSYLPTRFSSQIFDYIGQEHSSVDESVRSFESSVSAFYSDDSTYFS